MAQGIDSFQQVGKSIPCLTIKDREILDIVIRRFGRLSKKEIVDTMHKEDAYTETAAHDVIQFKYVKTWSLA